MKNLSGVVILLTSIIVSAQAFAGGQTNRAKVTRVYAAHNSSMVSVWLSSGGMTNPDGCKKQGKAFLEVKDDIRHQRMFSMIMTAATTKQDVIFQLNTCFTDSNGNEFPVIKAVNFY